ncbi:MAG: hypothetical protein NTZ20_02160 [Candidatus Levybacteria bacterium]|nr:hypothetical protein [Candidatus Levybacteria bacterium]
MNKNIVVAVIALVLVGVGIYFYTNSKNMSNEHGEDTTGQPVAQSHRGYDIEVTSNTQNIQPQKSTTITYKIKNDKDEMLQDGRIPILDFPLDRVNKLEKYKDMLYNLYIVPPTLGTLHTRVDKDQRGIDNDRYTEGRKELLGLVKNHFQHPDIHDVVINKDTSRSSPQILNLIYQAIS